VNVEFEPIVPLSIRHADGKAFTQDAIVDTGFNGWLSLFPDLIAELNLRWKRRGRAILGDGSECVFNVYEAVVVWDDALLTIPVDEADANPLVGMSLMEGYELKCSFLKAGRSRLAMKVEKALGVVVTSRNWRTVTKIVEMVK
jgi:clan AA aspartic protease